MKKHLRAMEEILFDLFANEGMRDSQEERNLWAIREGMRRLDPLRYDWRDVSARKEHECIRGHSIQTGQTYFVYNLGGYGNDLKLCAGCMSMTLYFAKVDKLPPNIFTHWDEEAQRPVKEKEV
jgi:hypothetical protein